MLVWSLNLKELNKFKFNNSHDRLLRFVWFSILFLFDSIFKRLTNFNSTIKFWFYLFFADLDISNNFLFLKAAKNLASTLCNFLVLLALVRAPFMSISKLFFSHYVSIEALTRIYALHIQTSSYEIWKSLLTLT